MMNFKRSRRILAGVLGAALLFCSMPSAVLADNGQSMLGGSGDAKETKEKTASGSISVKTLEQRAKDYNVSEDFLKAIKGKKTITEAQLKKYANQYNLSAQYVQRFIKTHFVFRGGKGLEYIPVNPKLAKNAYNWNNLVHSKKEIKYRSEALNGIKGIDVSTYQGDINWKKVKADGVQFAIIRLGYRGYGTGKLMLDDYYQKNIKNATAAGVKVGVYFYSQAINTKEAIEEAKMVLKYIKGYDLDYPVVFDIEDAPSTKARTAGLSSKTATDITIAFCDTIKAAGYRPMVYANSRWFVSRLDMSRLTKYDKWLAQYYQVPFFPYQFQIWQYSGKGRVDGIRGDVDMNISFKKY